MKKYLFPLISLILFFIILFSCEEKQEETFMYIEEMASQEKLNNIVENDSIIPLDEEKFPRVEKTQLRSSNNLWQDLHQLNGIEFFIQSKDTYFGRVLLIEYRQLIVEFQK